MKPNITTSSVDKTKQLRAQLASLQKKQVFVGVPEEKTARKGKITNAGLVYLHTHGSPLQGIPARPIIEPAIEAPDNKAMIAKELGEAAKSVMNQQPREVSAHLDRAGMLGRNAAVRWFVDARNGWAANSARTVKEKGSAQPLIDTAQMRRSISYIVTDK